MSLDILRAELTDDPLGRGYSGMSDEEAAADLNTAYRSRNLAALTASGVLNAVDVAEYNALDSGQQTLLWRLLGIGEAHIPA